MSDQLVDVLKSHRRNDKEECFKMGIPQKWVFHKGSKLYTGDTIRRVFDRTLKKAEIRRRRFHDIRHTTDSLLLSQGAPLVAVSHLLWPLPHSIR